MSIASRIEAIEQHLTDDYNVLEVAGADLTNVDKNILNLKTTWQERLLYFMNNGTDEVWNNWDKVTGEGEEISLNNTLEAKMKIVLKGNTYQYSTSGKNIFNTQDYFDYQATSTMISNNELKVTSTGTSTRRGVAVYPLDTNGNKILVSNILNKVIRIKTKMVSSTFDTNKPCYIISRGNGGAGTQDMVKSNTSENTIDYTFTSNNATYPYLCFYFMHSDSGGSVAVENETTFSNIIVTLDNSNMDFEPYTNGASPNPDYPQEVHTVSGDNEITICGKNLIDTIEYNRGINSSGVISGVDTHYLGISDYVSCKPSTTYTITFQHDISTLSMYIGYKDIDGNFINRVSSSSRTFTTPNNAYSMYVYVYKDDRFDTAGGYVQLEYGNKKTTYEPYKGKSYPIYLGVENLFDYTKISGVNNGTNDNGVITSTTNQSAGLKNLVIYYANGSITIPANTTIYFSADIKLNSNSTGGFGTINDNANSTTKVVDPTLSTTYQRYQTTRTYTSATTINAMLIQIQNLVGSVEVSNIMISIGKSISFTPYGTTPIELCKIGDYQDRIFKTSGKNLFEKTYFTTKAENWPAYSQLIGFKAIPFYVGAGKKVTFSSNVPVENESVIYGFDTNGFNEGTTNRINKNTSQTITALNDGYVYLGFVTTRQHYNDLLNGTYWVQVEEGGTVTSYEPYGNGELYLEKKIGKVVVNLITSLGTLANGNKYMALNTPYKIFATLYLGYCNRANISIHPSSSQPGQFYDNPGNIVFVGNSEDTRETMKAKYDGSLLYYILATPTYTKIEGELLSQLNALAKSYASQTNISQESNDLASILNATALREME